MDRTAPLRAGAFCKRAAENRSLLNSSEAAFGPEPTEQFQTPAMSQLPPGISVPDAGPRV